METITEFYEFIEEKGSFMDFGKVTTKADVIKILQDEIYIAQTFERNLSAKNLSKVLTYLNKQ